MMNLKKLILKHALVNAVQYEGEADVQAVLGKVIAERPALKGRVEKLVPEIKRIVQEVNSLSVEEQKERLGKLEVVVVKKVKKVGLPDLPRAKRGKVVMRLAPYPSGPLHIGNARMVVLNDEYVKKYKGRLLLVYDDTIGTEEKRLIPDGYKLIKEGLDWLGVDVHKIAYKSDRIPIFYKHAEQLIKKNLAYVCTCPVKKLRENRRKGIACGCREDSVNENLEKWRDMLAGKYKAGRAVVRLKTDMKHPNPAFRDRVLLRISDREHPRAGKKYKVWPMLEFSWAMDDHLLGVTHILRGKDLIMEDMMEDFIWEKLGWRKAEFVHYGLLNVKEAKLSKSKARVEIEKGELTGWDDPRTWSLQSLRKRGIQPQAVRNFIVNMGLSLADVNVPAEILYAENRKLIDPRADRYFAVLSPVKISIENAPEVKETKASLHPDFPRRGSRRIPVDLKNIYIEKDDLKKHKNKEVGLMNLFSVRLNGMAEFTSKKVKFEIPKIHWISEPNVKVKIVMPNGAIKQAMAEPAVKDLKADSLIQLQRVGFCRVDRVGKEIVLYFAHK